MILAEIRKMMEDVYRSESQMSAYKYIQGYIDGLKKYEKITIRDWHELDNYNHELLKHSLDVNIEKTNRSNIGRYIKLPNHAIKK